MEKKVSMQGNAIFGTGESVDEAWAAVVKECGPWVNSDDEERDPEEVYENDFRAYGATRALLDQVQEQGGEISWRIVRGVACTVEEADA
jgi:hypothetical protein